MAKLNWAGVISKGILKMKLAFDESVGASERSRILEHAAEEFAHSNISDIEICHFKEMSSLKARLIRPDSRN
ncbi:MAG: hypothetical protein IKQ46_06800 [Bacteroidales bacterium]|jgi:hypothetical protein|nr:hypothetical protein [Bacteroidales bacterium]